MAKVKISELPELNIATLDTTYVAGIYNDATYKIAVSRLTSSLDTTFATDLVVNAISGTISTLTTTASLNTLSTSVDSRLDTLESFSSSADNRYVLSGSITQTTWDNIANKPNDIVSSSTQISDLGFVTGSYTTITSFNNLTQSFNSISQSFTTISGSFGDIDFSGINAVTESYLQFTQSYYSESSSFSSRIEAATNEQYLAGFATTSSVNDLSTSVDNRLDTLENFSSSADSRYVLSGSVTQTTWENISGKPNDILSSSTQITNLGFISTSTDLSSLNLFTASQYISNSYFATTGSNLFVGDQTYVGNDFLNLSLGQTYGGGKVFYITNTYALIVDQSNLTTSINQSTAINTATGSAIGTGETNTLEFVNNTVISDLGAARLAYNSTNGGFNDWFLPSVDELVLAVQSGYGNFNGAFYRSSTLNGIYYSSVRSTDGLVVTSNECCHSAKAIRKVNITSSASLNISGSIYVSQLLSASVIDNLEIISASYLTFTQSYYSDSASFNSRIISGSAVAGTISSSAQISGLGYSTTSSLNSFTSSYKTDSASFDTRINSITLSGSNLNYLLEAYANVTYTLPGTFTEDPCRYSIVSVNENVPSSWFDTSTYTFTPQKAGYWEIAASYDVYRNAEASMAIKKNGSIVAAAGSFNAVAQQIKKIIYLNGSSDYINIINVGGAALQRAQFQSRSWFQAKFVGNTSGSTDLLIANNTFTGNNTFEGTTRFETVGGDEGGEIEFGVPQTNTSLSTRVVADVYRDRLRIFDGNTNGVFIDLSKAPTGVAGEIAWKTSGFVNAGTFLTLDNLKVSVTTSGYRGLSVGAVSTSFVANIAGWFGYSGGVGGASANSVTYTTTAAASAFGWGFNTEGDASNYIITDKTNSRVYRVTLMIGFGFNNNFISIERLH